MKILVVHNQYQQAGGEKAAVEAQLALLRSNGHDVRWYGRDNAEIEDYNRRRKALFFRDAVFSIRTYREVRALARSERPDVAHVHNVFPLVSPSVYRALADEGVPIVQTLHNYRLMCPNGLFFRDGAVCELCKTGNTFYAVRYRCYRQSRALSALYGFTIAGHRMIGTFRLVRRFIALTQFGADKVVEAGLAPRRKIAVLGNFVSEPLPEPGPADVREPYIVYVGRLAPEKGVETLIETMRNLPQLSLKILGDGPLAAALRSYVHEHSVANVEFLGHVVGPAKMDLVRHALALVMPSLCYETFGMVALESMSLGTPVVASATGSLSQIIADGKNGLLFRPGDSEDLKLKLQLLTDRPEMALNMRSMARQTVENKYRATVHYRELMQIYREVV